MEETTIMKKFILIVLCCLTVVLCGCEEKQQSTNTDEEKQQSTDSTDDKKRLIQSAKLWEAAFNDLKYRKFATKITLSTGETKYASVDDDRAYFTFETADFFDYFYCEETLESNNIEYKEYFGTIRRSVLDKSIFLVNEEPDCCYESINDAKKNIEFINGGRYLTPSGYKEKVASYTFAINLIDYFEDFTYDKMKKGYYYQGEIKDGIAPNGDFSSIDNIIFMDPFIQFYFGDIEFFSAKFEYIDKDNKKVTGELEISDIGKNKLPQEVLNAIENIK